MKIHFYFKINTLILFMLLVSCKEKSTKNEILIDSERNIEASTKNVCGCFNGIGSTEKDNPVLIHSFSDKNSVSICGYTDKEIQNKEIIISEFNVFDCNTGYSYVEYGALSICKIVEENKILKIQELKYLPVGENWEWQFLQIGEQMIYEKAEKIFVSESKPKIQQYSINKKLVNEFLDSLNSIDKSKIDWEITIGKLEALSIKGNKEAFEKLINLKEIMGDSFDGANSETWKDAISTIEWINNNK